MSQISPEIVSYFSQLIEKETGIQYNAMNQRLLENRLHELSKTLGHEDIAAFWGKVKSRGLLSIEKEMVLDVATNNETSFFRDPEVFDFFRNEFVMKSTKADSMVKIWCAATSTGQEPYSLAMTFAELRKAGIMRSYSLQCTDFSERVLKQAKDGIYSQLEVQRGLSASRLVSYFEQVTNEGSHLPKFKVKPEISQNMSFKRINLLDPWPNHGPFDIVFCRNVLIYQDIENKKKVIAKIADVLAPGGYLVLGGAESLLGLSNDFDMQIFGKACVYKAKLRLQASA